MRLTTVFMLGALALFGTLAYGDEPKQYRVDLVDGNIGAVQIAEGQYRIVVHRDGAEPKIRLIDQRNGNELEIAAKVENTRQKFARTEIYTDTATGSKQISEIRLGGTTLRINLRQGS